VEELSAKVATTGVANALWRMRQAAARLSLLRLFFRIGRTAAMRCASAIHPSRHLRQFRSTKRLMTEAIDGGLGINYLPF
jgi:hypothetical protein